MKKYDVVVIGSGVGGAAAAYALKDGKKNVALIEEDAWGGTCPNRGCDPKKVLIAGVEAIERVNQLAGKGFAPIHSINWPELMTFKRTFTDPFPASFKKEADAYGIETIKGTAAFTGPKQIEVNGETIEADAFVIATGQRSSLLDMEGKEHLRTSTDFLNLEKLPQTITFIGAGYIGFELAAIANAAGSEVTIIDHGQRPLEGFDQDLVSDLVAEMQKKGIRFVFNANVHGVKKEDDHFLLACDATTVKTDYIVCATGRIANVEKLNLENAGVTHDKRGIPVNGFLQTSNPAIFACGDIISKQQPKLTPVASFEGAYVAKRILNPSEKVIVYPPIATIVYASPKLAEVGVSIAEAKQQPDRYTVRDVDMTDWFTYRRIGEPVSKVKLVFEDHKLVGAAALSSQADELINYLAIVITKGISHDGIEQMVLGSPTIASDLSHLV